jgi:hypothetical protein
MDAYSRYPNRARPAAEPPRFGYKFDKSDAESPRDKFAAPDRQEPSGEKTEPSGEKTDEAELHYSGYKVIEPLPESPPEKITDTEPQIASGVSTDTKKKKAASKAKAPPPQRAEPQHNEPQTEPIPKLPKKPTMVYVTAVAGFGVLLGLVIAYWFIGNSGQYDLGAYTSSATGLKGHLSTKWEKKPMYRLTIEPSDKGRQEGFALAVANSPVPLSIEIHLQDSHGAVLCSKEIILKYNAGNAATLSASTQDSEAGETDAGSISNEQFAQRIDRARYEAEEPERELDKDIFQNQIGEDGQIASIHAEGEIPCSKKAYGNIFAWSFSSNFPAIAVQDELQKLQDEVRANEARLNAAELAARKKKAPKSAIKLLPFSMEGDDSIVEFDASRGVIETRGGKIFYFDKAGGQGADSKWQDYPVSIHYRCDRASNCILTQARLGALRARTNR